MKNIVFGFLRRGVAACGFGPVVLAVVYWILHHVAGVETLTVQEVCMGILSLTGLAFVAGGMNVIYQIERLPLMIAILIHGAVLYVGYLLTYLMNGWLQQGVTPLLVFTVIFVVGYLVIWFVIYAITKSRTAKINEALKRKRQNMEY